MNTLRLPSFKPAVLLAAVSVSLSASPAWADWRFEGGEGSSYAFETDGGFVEGSYKNGMIFSCTGDNSPCKLRVVINGKKPQPNAVVTFVFSDGITVKRLAEEVAGDEPQIGWEGDIMDGLKSAGSVKVNIGDSPGHSFALTGSSDAIRRAMAAK